MTVTTNWTGTYNGLSWGGSNNLQLVDLSGFRDMPTIRQGDVDNARRDGSSAGLDLLGERVFTVTLQAFGATVPFESVLASVTAAFQPISDPTAQLPFEVLFPGWATSRFITCRPTKGVLPINLEFQYNRSAIVVELTANDPLIYSSTLKTATAGLPSPTAGATFNATFNLAFGASTGGSLAVQNAGNYITAPVFTIQGPMTNPAVAFSSTGQFMQFNITLGASDVFVVDMGARTVTLNGTAGRFNTIITGSTWWGIPPGTWSIGVSSSDATSVSGTFTISYRDAWGFM